jgi:hypothetical protein
MRNVGYKYLAVAIVLILLAMLVFLPSGAGPGALPREMGFIGGLHNSLLISFRVGHGKSAGVCEKKAKRFA